MWDTMRFCGVDMSRRGNRRTLVAVVYVALWSLWGFVWQQDARGSRAAALILMYAVLGVAFFVFGGYGRRGLIKPFCMRRPFGRPTEWRNDEFDVQKRDHAHFYGYRVVMCLMVSLYATTTVPDFQLTPTQMRACVMAILLIGFTLPSAIILWREPDFEREEAA